MDVLGQILDDFFPVRRDVRWVLGHGRVSSLRERFLKGLIMENGDARQDTKWKNLRHCKKRTKIDQKYALREPENGDKSDRYRRDERDDTFRCDACVLHRYEYHY